MARGLALNLLGHPQLTAAGRPLAIGRRHVLALLAILAEADAPVARVQVAEMLWPECDEATVRARLRRLLHRIAELGSRPTIKADGDTMALDVQRRDVDSRRFVDEAEDAIRTGDVNALAAVAALYRAPFLDGFTLPGAPGFEDWVIARRSELERLQMRVLRTLAEGSADHNDFDRAVDAASRLIALDPLRESSYRLLMRLHAGSGNAKGLDDVYNVCVRTLSTELGTKPSPETAAEYRKLRTQEGSLCSGLDAVAPVVRFASVEGGSVAYAMLGKGPVVVIVPGFVSHIEMAWEEPRLAAFLRRLAETHRVICFDRRGLGVSERLGVRPSIDSAVSDIGAILRHAGIDRAVLFGASEGGSIAVRFAFEWPEKVAGLVLFGSLARGSWAPDHPWALKPEAFDRWRQHLVAGWGTPVSLDVFAPSASEEPEFKAWWGRMLRQAATPGSIGEVLRALGASDIRALLSGLRVKTTVLHRRGDRAVRFEAGEYLARQIAGARFIPLEGSDHFFWIGDQEPIVRAIADMSKGA